MKTKYKVLIAGGLFVLRFIPIYELDLTWLDAGVKKITINQMTSICSTPLLGAIPVCNEVKFISGALWVGVAALVGWAIYDKVKGDKK